MDQLKSGSEIEVQLSTLDLDSKWSEKTYFLDEIVNELELPQIAKVCSPTAGSDLARKVDTSSAFLLYSRRRRTKVVAQMLYYDDRQRAWVPDGPNLEIPKDYTGWFEKVEGDGLAIHRTYSACDSIDQVVRSSCRKFLVRSTVVGHSYREDENGIVLLEEVKIYVGEILRCEGVVKRKWKVVNKSASELASVPETRFLKCVDPKKNNICVSLGHPGKFSPIYDPKKGDGNPPNAVYQIRDILEQQAQYPMAARLAFGWMPKVALIPRSFQGVIQFVGTIRPDTLVMCSLVKHQMPLIEVPINMDVKVIVNEGKEKWLNHPSSEKTLRKCYNFVYPFLTSMKIMDIKYKARAISQEGDNGSVSQHAPKYGRMTSPMDMNTFNPLDVYPPMVKSEDISDTWTLSFKDPEHVIDEMGHVVEGGNKVYLRDSAGAQIADVKRDARPSVANDTSGHRKKDLRAMRDKELRNREANC